MHVSISDLRAVRRGPLSLRCALFDDVAVTLAETPELGSAGTSLEEPCTEAHWSVVLRGTVELVRGDERFRLTPGSGFYVPSGPPEHRIYASARTLIAGMVPLARRSEAMDDRPEVTPRALGIVDGGMTRTEDEGTRAVMISQNAAAAMLDDGRIRADMAVMGEWVFTRATFGRTSGFTSGWCDAAHYGLQLSGSMTIDWENDVEVVSAGDVYHCPPGPPGHRFEVADDAVAIDLTPCAALLSGGRIAGWRPTLLSLQAAR